MLQYEKELHSYRNHLIVCHLNIYVITKRTFGPFIQRTFALRWFVVKIYLDHGRDGHIHYDYIFYRNNQRR